MRPSQTTHLLRKRVVDEVHRERRRSLLQSKREERNQGDCDEGVPSGTTDSRREGLCQWAKGTGDFWRELSLPSISSDWRVHEKTLIKFKKSGFEDILDFRIVN